MLKPKSTNGRKAKASASFVAKPMTASRSPLLKTSARTRTAPRPSLVSKRGQMTSDTQRRGAQLASNSVARKRNAGGQTASDTHTARAASINSAAPAKAKSSRAAKTGGKVSRGHGAFDTQPARAPATLSDGHAIGDSQPLLAVAPSRAGHHADDPQDLLARATPQASWPLPAEQQQAIIALNETWRMRQGIVKAMTKLSLQAQASLREGRTKEEAAKFYGDVSRDGAHPQYSVIAPYLEAQEPLARYRASHEKTLVQYVKTLPIYTWAKGVPGLGDVSLAGIIGECSGFNVETNEWWSIGQMKSVSAVWKRLGVAVMSGIRQGDATAGLTKADWVEHGYVKTRRSVLWNVGECVVKAQWRKENTVHAYGKFYGEEKARLQALNESGAYAETAARIVERMKKAGSKPLAENLAGRLTPAHINNRAKRHMTKRLIADLYVAWRAADRGALGYAPVAEAA